MSELSHESDTNHRFYLEGGVSLPEYQALPIDEDTVIRIGRTPFLEPSSLLDVNDIGQAMREIAMNRTVVEYGGSSFDISVANAEATKGTIAMPATANSSLDNHGNGYEMAAAAVRYPYHRLVYIASPGQGGSSPLPKTMASYYRREGRLIDPFAAGQPSTYARNMYRALTNYGIDITHLSADSTGNQYAQALGTALEPGQLQAAHFSESTGFVDLGLAKVGFGMVYTEDRKNKAWNIERSFDPEKLTDAMQDQYKRVAVLYMSRTAIGKIDESRSSIPKKAGAFWTNLQGLRRGYKDGYSPLAEDANALLARQPQARLVYSLGDLDPLYVEPDLAHHAAKKFLDALILPDSADVRAVMIPGMTHKINTYFPGLHHAIKRYALFGGDSER